MAYMHVAQPGSIAQALEILKKAKLPNRCVSGGCMGMRGWRSVIAWVSMDVYVFETNGWVCMGYISKKR